MFTSIIKTLVVHALCLFALDFLLPTVSFNGNTAFIVATLVFAFVQILVKPIAHAVFWPFKLVTFGLATVVINTGLLWLVTYLVPGFTIQPMILFGVPLNQLTSFAVTSFLLNTIIFLFSWL